MNFFNEDYNAIIKTLNSSHSGISQCSVSARKEQYGQNILDKQKKKSFIKKLLLEFKNVMIIILFLSAIISCALAIINHDYENLFEGLLIFAIVIINAVVAVLQEQKAENALEALTQITEPFATVIRDGIEQKIKTHDVVVGDIILLKTGDFVPSDIRIIEAQNLKCNESSLTGEGLSINKQSDKLSQKNPTLSQQSNMCFSGTSVTSGRAKGIVVAVGKNTEIGKIAKILGTEIKEKTPLEKEIDKIGKVLTIGVLLIVAIVFVVQLLLNSTLNFVDALLTAVTLAVAAIPESLPAVITIIMAMGVGRLAKKNAIIKKLSAVETLGCCNVICTDKTGTLTKNEMKVMHICNDLKITQAEHFKLSKASKICQIQAICNNISFSYGKPVGDATETAIANFLISKNIDIINEKKFYKRLAESEFDSRKKQMRIIVQNGTSKVLFVKGAIDFILKSCNKILINGEEHQLSDAIKNKINKLNEEICKCGERVIAFAYKEKPSSLDDDNLVFVGFAGIIDPPRAETYAAIRKCKTAGLRTIMITGDHPTTALAIAKKLKIASHKNEVLTGADINHLSDEELKKNISHYRVFARVSPEHKLRIVASLKANGNIVAMTGDGINDAPSIKSANIGVSMGKTGTDVTKEVSDIIISDDNFSSIVLAIEEGRTIYQNITKTIIFLLSTNLVEVLGIFITSLIMHNSVFLLPTQILFINLITDSLPAFALGIEPSERNIMNIPPRNSNKSILAGKTGSLILIEGFIQSLAVLLMFVIATHKYDNEIASTMSFLTICLMQIIHAINCKSNKSILKMNIFKNKFFNFSFIILLALILGVYFIPTLSTLFSLAQINIHQWLYVIITSISIIPLVELTKLIINKKY